MKKIVSVNIGLITLTVFFYIAYYLLLQDNFLHISISSIIHESHQLENKEHLLVLALLPIYIALMIFGAGLIGLHLGAILQQLVYRGGKSRSSF